MAKSIYREVIDAARTLLEDPSRRAVTRGPEGIFTELDVLMLAQRQRGAAYEPDEMRTAQRDGSNAMLYLYRNLQAVRFGPVEIPGLLPDYMRIASKLVFASPDGPSAIKTPNGTFPQLRVMEDPIGQQGRRVGSFDRNDLEPWEEQNLIRRQTPRLAPRSLTKDQLHARVTELEEGLAEARRELARLRDVPQSA